jgi:hypothetical protein
MKDESFSTYLNKVKQQYEATEGKIHDEGGEEEGEEEAAAPTEEADKLELGSKKSGKRRPLISDSEDDEITEEPAGPSSKKGRPAKLKK